MTSPLDAPAARPIAAADHDVRLLLLDAGNTVIYLDHDAVADIATSHGVSVDGRVLRAREGDAKRRYEALMAAGVPHEDGWGMYLRTLLEAAGVEAERARELVGPLRLAHDAMNLWRRVPASLPPALARWKASGRRVAIVSNSEGRLAEIFERVGLGDAFEAIVDSHYEGVRKPDPEIFHRALGRLRVAPDDAIYLGDIPGVDVAGAHAASMRAVLVDTLGFYPDAGVPTVHDVATYIASVLDR